MVGSVCSLWYVYMYIAVRFMYVFVWFTRASVFIWLTLYGLGCMCIMYVSDLQLLLGNMLGEEYDCFQNVYMYVVASVFFTGCWDTAGVCVYMCVCVCVVYG